MLLRKPDFVCTSLVFQLTILSAEPAAVRSTIFEIKFVLQKGVHYIFCIYTMYSQRNEVKTMVALLVLDILLNNILKHYIALIGYLTRLPFRSAAT